MPTRTELEALTVDDLRALASEADVDGRSSMTKSELVDALADEPDQDDGPTVPAAPPPTGAGGIDERLVAARDETRAREDAEAAAVEDRPVVGGIDPLLVERREATRQADAAEVSVSEAPSGGQ